MSLRFHAALAGLFTALLLTSCFDSNTIECSGGVVCPSGSTCTADGLGCVSSTGCGDRMVSGDEECDDGNQNDEDDCTADCRINICGDGHLDKEGTEQEDCDVFGGVDTDDCDGSNAATVGEDCTPAECGDGYTNAAHNEICDDGNIVSGDGTCKNDCSSDESCGNGIIDSHLPGTTGCGDSDTLNTNCPEKCDDGPGAAAGVSGDGCSRNCLSLEMCGNGIRDPLGNGPGTEDDELCDDGDPLDPTCDDDCKGGTGCGNGIVEQIIGEDCDNGTSGGTVPNTDTCDNDCSRPDCGDGLHNMEAGELCDPGSTGTVGGSSATCNYDCSLPECGDGIINRLFTPLGGTVVEECDDGDVIPGDGCSATCQIETCGNGVTEMINGEQCDDNNTNDLDACRTNCQLPRCGDGIASTPPNEICDTNGNSQTCNADCTLPSCGDNKVNPAFLPTGAPAGAFEACDDGNIAPGDGCSALCRIESCGNGITETINGEQCDDMNVSQTDDCLTNCQFNRCGDGHVDMQGGMTEACDSNGVNTSMCDTDCTVPMCNDGIVNPTTLPLPEQCEDGNVTNGDGCSSSCRLEPFPVTVIKAGTGTGLVTSGPPGINCGTDCSELYLVGTMVTLSAMPATNSTFTGWSGGGCTGTGACMMTMDAAKTVTATFAATTITVVKAGTGGGTVTSTSPAGAINCGVDCTETVNTGTTVTLTTSAQSNSSFIGWSGTGVTCPGTGNCTVTMDQAKTVTATFDLRQFTLSLTKAGTGQGTVSSGPAGIDCGPACNSQMASFTADTMVTLVAAAESNSNFTGWSGVTGCPGTGNCVVSMTMARSVTATFTFKTFTVSITKSGAGGTVTATGINCGGDCNETVPFGTTVTLTATPNAGNAFIGWSGGSCTGTGQCMHVVDSNVTINAAFADNTLTVVRTGDGAGTVTGPTGDNNGINCGTNCSEDYNAGTMVTLVAAPASDARFNGWSGTGVTCPGLGLMCTVTMTLPTTVTAEFLDVHVLTLNKAGAGTGLVTSNPPGINCNAGCNTANATFDEDTVIMLTATATTPGSFFSGWSGTGITCPGTGTCNVTLTQARTVTATFGQTFTLNLAKAGTGMADGTVQSMPGGIDCGTDCTEDFNSGISVTLIPSTMNGATFTGWSGSGITCPGTGNCTVNMTAARNVTATFAAAPMFALNLSVMNAGTVTGTGINCTSAGTPDCTESFTSGTMVMLTASGVTPITWAGGGCATPALTCLVTMDMMRAVTATFP